MGFVIVLALFIPGVFASPGLASWTQTPGPEGGSVKSLVVDPNDPDTVYVATGGLAGGAVFKSVDGAETWQPAGTPLTGEVRALAISASTPTRLYAGGPAGVAWSIDGGATWSELEIDEDRQYISTLAVDPANPMVVYAGSEFSGLFKSTDGGVTWSPVNQGLNNGQISSIVIDPGNQQVIYVGTALGVFKSTNGGQSWSPSSSGLPGGDVRAMARASSSTLYAGQYPGVYKSTDAGNSWTRLSSGLPEYTSVWAIALAPSAVYAATSDGVFKSTDDGTTWTPARSGIGATSVFALGVNPQAPTTIYAGATSGVFRSTNAAASWAPAQSALVGTTINDLAVHSDAPSTVFAATGLGISRTGDGGQTWEKLNASGAARVIIDPANAQTVYATTGSAVLKSTDGGDNWVEANNGIAKIPWLDVVGIIGPLTISPVDGTLYVPTISGDYYRSADGAATWSEIERAPGTTIGLAADPFDAGIVYAATMDGVFKSEDRGDTWNSIGTLDGGLIIGTGDITVDPTTPGRLYVSTWHSVYRSSDYGQHWVEITAGLSGGATIAVDPSTSGTIYAATGEGVFKSTNGGDTWKAARVGLRSPVTVLAIDPSNPLIVYSGTNARGVFKTTNGAEPPPDTTPPIVTIQYPAEGQTFTVGDEAYSAYSCSDGEGWGILSCTGPYQIDTSVPGTKTFTVETTDNAGNTATKSVTYQVKGNAPGNEDTGQPTAPGTGGHQPTAPGTGGQQPTAPGGGPSDQGDAPSPVGGGHPTPTAPEPPAPAPAPRLAPAMRVAAPAAKLTAKGNRLRVALTAKLPVGAKGRTARVEVRRGKKWVRVAQVKVPANRTLKRTITLTRAQIGGVRAKTVQLRIVLTRTAKARASIGKTRTLRVPAAKKAPARR